LKSPVQKREGGNLTGRRRRRRPWWRTWRAWRGRSGIGPPVHEGGDWIHLGSAYYLKQTNLDLKNETALSLSLCSSF